MPRVSRQQAWERLDAPAKLDLVLTDLDTNDDEHKLMIGKLDGVTTLMRGILVSVTVAAIMLALNAVLLLR